MHVYLWINTTINLTFTWWLKIYQKLSIFYRLLPGEVLTEPVLFLEECATELAATHNPFCWWKQWHTYWNECGTVPLTRQTLITSTRRQPSERTTQPQQEISYHKMTQCYINHARSWNRYQRGQGDHWGCCSSRQ